MWYFTLENKDLIAISKWKIVVSKWKTKTEQEIDLT